MTNENDKKCLDFIHICNNLPEDDKDYFIAKSILDSLSNIKDLSLDEISAICLSSPATISRFIKRMQFDSFSDFKLEFTEFLAKAKTRKLLVPTKNGLIDTFNEAVINMQSTVDSISKEQLETFYSSLISSKKVIFVCDYVIQKLLYPLQLDLISQNISSSFLSFEQLKTRTYDFTSETTFVFITMCTNWFSEEKVTLAKEIKKHSCTLLTLTQGENKALNSIADISLVFGKNEDYHVGCHSIIMLIYYLAGANTSSYFLFR